MKSAEGTVGIQAWSLEKKRKKEVKDEKKGNPLPGNGSICPV